MTFTSCYLWEALFRIFSIFFLASAEGGRTKTFIHSYLETGQTEYLLIFWPLGREVSVYLGPGVQAFMPLNFGRKLKATNMLKYVKTFLTVYKNGKIYRYLTWPWGNIVPKSFMYMSHLFQQSSNVKKSTNIALKKDHYNIWYNIEGWKRSSYIAFWAFLSAW